MKIFFACLLFPIFASAQNIESIIDVKEVTRIESALAADSMQGRGIFGAGIHRAADFICREFAAAALKPYFDSTYLQPFDLVTASLISTSGEADGQVLSYKRIVAFTDTSDLDITNSSNFNKVFIRKGDDFEAMAKRYISADSNFLVFVNNAFAHSFKKLAMKQDRPLKRGTHTVFVLIAMAPAKYHFNIRKNVLIHRLNNIVGVIPGRTAPGEFVIFSAHYDHLGTDYPDATGDSIYNGANDDASGTAAVMMLAKYFNVLRNNERTLIFAAFTGEESGALGSAYFAKQIDPVKVVAMFNIEMIGTESKWGRNAAFITGYDRSDMGYILQRNLAKSDFRFYPDPYPEQNLFFRSDNASLAAYGVPAHTISTSKMDAEKNYHTLHDEVGTLDLENMTRIIRSIALSANSIITREDTPTRITL
jgi:hypothetical protein